MKALILDVETTGLPKNRTIKLEKQPEIIEFYGQLVNLKNGKIGPKLALLIKPSKPLSDTPEPGSKKTITQITGITNDMLKNAPSFLIPWLESLKRFHRWPFTIEGDCTIVQRDHGSRLLGWPFDLINPNLIFIIFSMQLGLSDHTG